MPKPVPFVPEDFDHWFQTVALHRGGVSWSWIPQSCVISLHVQWHSDDNGSTKEGTCGVHWKHTNACPLHFGMANTPRELRMALDIASLSCHSKGCIRMEDAVIALFDALAKQPWRIPLPDVGVADGDVCLLYHRARRCPLITELLLSFFLEALWSSRATALCTPFPPGFLTNTRCKDVARVRTILGTIPPVQDLTDHPECLTTLSPDALRILLWIVYPRGIELQILPFDRDTHGTPIAQLEVFYSDNTARFLEFTSQYGIRTAYHGSPTENLHAILRMGLLNLSGTKHQRHGAAFGDGIYLSSDLRVALMFSQPSWRVDRLIPFSAVALCDIVDHPDIRRGHEPKHAVSFSGGQLPDTYYIVSNPDLVQLRYLLVYRHGAPRGQRDRCWVWVIVLYVLAMLVLGLYRKLSSGRWGIR